MPSVRVRRNTATVAALVPAERLQTQSTRARGNSRNRSTVAGQDPSVTSNRGEGEEDSAEQVVCLAPPVSVEDFGKAADSIIDSPSKNNRREITTATSVEATMSPPTTERSGSGSDANPSSRRRPRSRTIQAIFPQTEEIRRGSLRSPQGTGDADFGQNVIQEEPTAISPVSVQSNRRSGESRLSSDERTHRAEVIARARGESIASTSGAAPIGIRLSPREKSQVAEAIESPTKSTEGADVHRRRSASISLALANRSRRSAEAARLSGERPRSATQHLILGSGKPMSESVSSASGPPTRARSRTLGGPIQSSGRGRSDSVGLMSYFGLGNGVEAKMQSWEESRRDLEKGGQGKGSAVRRGLTPAEEAEEEALEEEHHEDEVVEHLDVIDPEISAVSHLQNFANSIMIPYIPELYSRRPVLDLPGSTSTKPPADAQSTVTASSGLRQRKPTISPRDTPTPIVSTNDKTLTSDKTLPKPGDELSSITESSEEEDALDQHVKDVLKKSKKEWLKRSLKGVWAFLKTPLGIITGIYGFMVVFWGAALVLFLLGWIPTSSKNTKDIWVERCSQIENGLFTVTGVGFIPWRVMDVYRIYRIWSLKRLSVKLRKQRGLPPIEDPDDLPDPKLDPDFVPVLTEYQQALLEYQQERFMASQTWYRPHATETHRAFSIEWALYICLFIVGNSVFQCMLCGCMWGLNRHQRPAWTTGSLIPLSFGCGIASGILIWKGGERTKKKAQVEKKLRKALGMDSHEGSIDNVEKAADSSPRKEDTRSSVDSYIDGEAGPGSSGPSDDRDSQRLLSAKNSPTQISGFVEQQNTQAVNSREEYEMLEKRELQSRADNP